MLLYSALNAGAETPKISAAASISRQGVWNKTFMGLGSLFLLKFGEHVV
jgi:hypothetical protein